MLGEAAAVVTTLKNATDLIQKLRNSNSVEELQIGIASLTEMVISARLSALDILDGRALLQDEVSALKQRIEALDGELRHLVDFEDKSDKYERIALPNRQFVYREKTPLGGNAGAPYLCPKCFADKKVNILQGREHDGYHVCPSCRFSLVVFGR